MGKSSHFWEDTGEGIWQLNYLRNKAKTEVDFLIVKDKKPFLSIECKYGDQALDPCYQSYQQHLQCPHLQIVFETEIFRKVNETTYIISADYFLSQLV